ncbi:MAG: hypothetical protein HY830_21205 [Actinobacteria bacterium]|nr:hypothetical protein [Actinomycetota bacterium]
MEAVVGSCTWVERGAERYLRLVTGRSDGSGLIALTRDLHRLVVAEPPGPVRVLVDAREQPFVLDARLMTESKRLHVDALREHTLRIVIIGRHPAGTRLVAGMNFISGRTTVLAARDEEHAWRLLLAAGT